MLHAVMDAPKPTTAASSIFRTTVTPQTDIDPLGADSIEDLPVVTSQRRLRRLAIVAAETGARFEREGIAHDPVAWLAAPRQLFHGGSAIDACQDREGFMRATLLHGLGLGLDADADEMDELLADDEAGETYDLALDVVDVETAPKLFTCFVDGPLGDGGRCVQAFCASVMNSGSEMRRRLAARFGGVLADAVVVHEGIDLNHPLADYLVPDGLLRVLAMAEREPAGEFGQGLDVVLEQRFAA